MLLAGNGKYGLGIRACDSQQGASSATRLFAALFPTLQGANRHANERCELRLREASLFSCLNHWRRNDMDMASLHFTYRLQKISSEVALGFVNRQLGFGEGLTLR
jgi:hypothetical protein